MFTVAARHRYRKMRFIHLFVNLSSTKRIYNEYSRCLTYPDHHYNCIKSLIIRYEEVFLDRIRFESDNFCSNSIMENIYCLVHMRNCELNRYQNLIGCQMAVQN